MSFNKLKLVAFSIYYGLTAEDPNLPPRSTIHRWSIHGFWLSLLALPVLIAIGNDSVYWMVAATTAVCSLIICGFAFICSLAARDLLKWKNENWRFSLKDLLIAVTVVALALGGIIYAARN
jgi:amino acid transporter